MPDRISSPFGTVQLSPGKHDSLLERMFGETAPDGPARNPRTPPIDVIEFESGFSVLVDLPGLEKEDIEVKCNGRLLSINAEVRAREVDDGTWVINERRVGRFVRGIELGVDVDANSISASFTAGVLTVSIQKPSDSIAEAVTIPVA